MESKSVLDKLIARKNLTQKEATETMQEIVQGHLTPSQIAGILVALRSKGETVDEVAGFALAMRDAARPLIVHSDELLDCCGTGGDGQGSFNISTAAALVAAGAGYRIAKHGNKAVSSKCGSADVLNVMGVRIDPPVAVVEHCINTVGIGFLYAPNFHPAMKHAMPTRRELGIRTVFNLLGPLTNPARTSVQLIGVPSPHHADLLARVLVKMKHKAGLVVHSQGWDEITLDGPTRVSEMLKGKIRNFTWTAKNFGLPRVKNSRLKGGNSHKNAQIIMDLLEGRESDIKPVVVANAAALIYIAERGFNGNKISLKEAVRIADKSITSTAAYAKFREFALASQTVE